MNQSMRERRKSECPTCYANGNYVVGSMQLIDFSCFDGNYIYIKNKCKYGHDAYVVRKYKFRFMDTSSSLYCLECQKAGKGNVEGITKEQNTSLNRIDTINYCPSGHQWTNRILLVEEIPLPL